MRKIRASSLLETLIALTISVLIVGFVSFIFVQVTSKSISSRVFEAEELLNYYSTRSIARDSLFDSQTTMDGLILKRRIFTIDSLTGVYKAEFTICEENGLILVKSEKYILSDADGY